MGFQVPNNPEAKINAEARAHTFVLFTEDWHHVIELPWEELENLRRIADELLRAHVLRLMPSDNS